MFDRMKDMANPDQIREVVGQVDYPAEKQEIVDKAQEQGANDMILSALDRIPERVYQDPKSVIDEVQNVAGF